MVNTVTIHDEGVRLVTVGEVLDAIEKKLEYTNSELTKIEEEYDALKRSGWVDGSGDANQEILQKRINALSKEYEQIEKLDECVRKALRDSEEVTQ